MGCDIHATIEVNEERDFWIGKVRDIGIDRNYELFSLIAGVRNYDIIPPKIAPRGFPNNASWESKEELEEANGDSHTPSFLTFRELNEILTESLKEEIFFKIMKLYSEIYGEDRVRLVFFFDN